MSMTLFAPDSLIEHHWCQAAFGLSGLQPSMSDQWGWIVPDTSQISTVKHHFDNLNLDLEQPHVSIHKFT